MARPSWKKVTPTLIVALAASALLYWQVAPQATAAGSCTFGPRASWPGAAPLEYVTVTYRGAVNCDVASLFGGQASIYNSVDMTTPLSSGGSVSCPDPLENQCTSAESRGTVANVLVGSTLRLVFSVALTRPNGNFIGLTSISSGSPQELTDEQKASLCSGYNTPTLRCTFIKEFVVRNGPPGAPMAAGDDYEATFTT